MPVSELITPDAILPSLRSSSKTAAFQEMSERACAVSGLPARDILEAVNHREHLGSTGVGNGIAIPHGKLPRCDRIFGVFARLEKPIEYDAMDGMPVDLLFLLIASEAAGADHLKALAKVARFLRGSPMGASLRATRDSASLFALLSQSAPASNAA